MTTNDGPYHHGNLREALLAAAIALVEEGGTEAVTLRATARKASVSHAAPYHHFADKAALIEAIAARGFEDFTRDLERARDANDGNALTKLRATGIAYVAYAVEHPGLFRLMNRAELRSPPEGADPGPVQRAAGAAYAVLRDGIRACQEEGSIAPGGADAHALTAWSLVHGLAVLAIDGLIHGRPVTTDEARAMAESVTDVLGMGLLRRGAHDPRPPGSRP